MKSRHIIVCFSIAKDECKYCFIRQREKSMEFESWKRNIVYFIFLYINTSLFPNFISSFHLHHLYQIMDVKCFFFIIYFFNTFQKYKVSKESDQTSYNFSLVGLFYVRNDLSLISTPEVFLNRTSSQSRLRIIVHTSYYQSSQHGRFREKDDTSQLSQHRCNNSIRRCCYEDWGKYLNNGYIITCNN